jgi:porin
MPKTIGNILKRQRSSGGEERGRAALDTISSDGRHLLATQPAHRGAGARVRLAVVVGNNVRLRRWFGLGMVGIVLLMGKPAMAQQTDADADVPIVHPPAISQRGSRPDPSPSSQIADTQNRPPPGLLGDWGGIRPALRERGVEVSARYASESAYNPTGGQRQLYRETGQFDIGATADMGRLAGIEGGTFQATVTYRRGYDLGAAAGLGVLQQVQEVYGRGQTLRLTQFWYEQAFGAAKLKVGRSSPGEDFEGFSCHFQNLSFCGSQPGNLVGDYWYNWPVSQWAARLRVDHGTAFVQLGAYEVNPRNLDRDFLSWHLHGATGVLVPAELGWSGVSGRSGHVWAYRVGGWWSSADASDVLLDVNRRPLVVGMAPLQRSSRYGGWLTVQQQLTGRAENGKSVSGLSAFLNVTQADRLTSVTDNQVALGLFYKGLGHGLPGDVLGLGVARTNLNSRAIRGGTVAAGPSDVDPRRLDAEYAGELYYSFHPMPWLELRPNVQGIHQPGGRRGAPAVVVLGLKGAVTL